MKPRLTAAGLGRYQTRLTVMERFEKYHIPEPNSGCWLWIGCVDPNGYGLLWVREANRKVSAHRYSYSTFRQALPDGLVVRHKCDNPACVNPDHLVAGTQRDNVADMFSRGRAYVPRGASQPNAILTDDAVRAIRRETGRIKDIAEKYGLDPSHCSKILKRKVWSHVS